MASGVMQIKYGEERIASKASKACNELEDICSSLSKVRKKLNGLPERSRGGDNLSSASAFLKKKQKQYETRQNALEVLKTRTNNFMSKVETTEKKLSSQIKKEYKQFNKQTGIGKTRGAVILDGLKKAGKFVLGMATYLIPGYGTYKLVKDLCAVGVKIVDAIKTWYNNLPESVKFVMKAVAAVVVAVVAIVAVVGAVAAAGAAIVAAAGAIGAAFAGTGTAAAAVLLAVKAVGATVAAIGTAITTVDSLVDAGKKTSTVVAYASGAQAYARELDASSTGEFLSSLTGGKISAESYKTFTKVGGYMALGGSITVSGVNIVTSMSEGTKFLKAFGTEALNKYTGRKYLDSLKKQGGILKVLTTPIKLTSSDFANGVKGIKAVYDWASLKKITSIKKVFTASSFGEGLYNLVDFVF